MSDYSEINKINKINRIIDANINRAKEGLRVCEEITRFILNNAPISRRLKKIRHSIEIPFKRKKIFGQIIKVRDVNKDVGKDIIFGEFKRKDINDVFFANIWRVKESIRVLEEFLKIIDKKTAIEFKKIRYELYDLEKRIIEKLSSLSDF